MRFSVTTIYSPENPAKRRKLIALIKSLQEQKPRHGHRFADACQCVSSPSFEEMDQTLTELAASARPFTSSPNSTSTVQGGQRNTGADISENAATTRQAASWTTRINASPNSTQIFFKAFLKHKDSVKMVTFGGE